jgi:hypothetical protein
MLTGHSASCARFASAITIAIRSSNRKLEHKNIFELDKPETERVYDQKSSHAIPSADFGGLSLER